MTRPTIRDLAEAAGVSISTVNRVLSGGSNVRDQTVREVKDAAERIGFYGLGAIRSRVIARRSKFKFGFLLLQPSRIYYQHLGASLEAAARAVEEHDIQVQVVYADDLSPQIMSEQLLELGKSCDAVGVVASVHPLMTQAIDELAQRNVPVFALISQLSATGSVNYVGLDNWKAGRMFGWAVAQVCKSPGKVGILVGNHRFRCQDMNESGLRSYFREYAPEFTLLEPLSTFETSAIAEEMTEKLIAEHPDLKGLIVAGGGISGVMNALRSTERAGKIVAVGHQLLENTKLGLLDGTLTLIISNPTERFTRETIAAMIRACNAPPDASTQTIVLPFEIYTRENI